MQSFNSYQTEHFPLKRWITHLVHSFHFFALEWLCSPLLGCVWLLAGDLCHILSSSLLSPLAFQPFQFIWNYEGLMQVNWLPEDKEFDIDLRNFAIKVDIRRGVVKRNGCLEHLISRYPEKEDLSEAIILLGENTLPSTFTSNAL